MGLVFFLFMGCNLVQVIPCSDGTKLCVQVERFAGGYMDVEQHEFFLMFLHKEDQGGRRVLNQALL